VSVFAGTLRCDGRPAGRSLLEALTLPPYGVEPAAVGVWQDGGIGLGHALVAASDGPGEGQPLRDSASGCAIVFDGRLDNRSELQSQLTGFERLTGLGTDAAYTLAAYLRWGEGLVHHLLGDFAFAIWDPGRRALLLARDPVGMRPLYYRLWGGHLTFASTLEQLLRDPSLPRSIDEDAVVRYLYGNPGRPRGEQTYYQHVRRLPGGHTLVATEGDIRLRRYWQWRDEPPERSTASPADVEEFRALLTEAVRCRLPGAGVAGVLLSGGLDSGAVACVASHLLQETRATPIHAYSMVFDRFTPCDERRYSSACAERYGFPHTCLPVDDCWTLSHFETWLPAFTEPFFAPYDGALYELLAQARADGRRTLLMGHGGDLLLIGSAHYLADWLFQGRWRAVQEQVRIRARKVGKPYLLTFADSVLVPLLPVPLQRQVWTRVYGWQAPAGAWLPAHIRDRFHPKEWPDLHTGRRAWWYFLRGHVNALGQNPDGAYLDRMMRLFGLEVRQPFLDVRLLQFMLGAPPDAAYRDGTIKWVLREALRDILPPVVRDRPDKANFGPLLEFGLREGRRRFVEALLQDSELERRGYVVPGRWREAVQRFLQGRTGHSSGLWQSLTLEMWLRVREGRLPALA
jgi:asparagine synthase (glutamine-hydrolysing)